MAPSEAWTPADGYWRIEEKNTDGQWVPTSDSMFDALTALSVLRRLRKAGREVRAVVAL